MTCRQMGGMCDEEIKGETKEEILDNGMKHLDEKHPEMAATVRSMPADHPAMVEWNKKFEEEYEKTPDAA